MRRTAGTALVLALLTPLVTATPGHADDRVDLSPEGAAPRVEKIEITASGLHHTLSPADGSWGPGGLVVTRRLRDADGAVRVGSPQAVDWVTHRDDRRQSIAALDDALVYAAGPSMLVRRHDDGTVEHVDVPLGGAVESCTPAWCTTTDALVALPAGRAPTVRFTSLPTEPAPWVPGATIRTTVRAQVSDRAAVWQEVHQTYGSADSVLRVHALPLGTDGPTGDPVVLPADPATAWWASAVAASDAAVVWTSAAGGPAGATSVRWVPADDLGAEPRELELADHVTSMAVDGDRLAIAAGDAITVLDLPTGEVLRTVEAPRVSAVDLRGDLLAWAAWKDGRTALELLSTTGRDLQVLPAFPDVDLHNRFVPEIDALRERGVVTGYADGTFRPTATLNRDAMAAFLYRLVAPAGYQAPSTPVFRDVPRDHPFYTEISWLAAEGVSTGWATRDGQVFRPAEPVTREATAAFLHRLAGEPAVPDDAPVFTDVAPGHPFAASIAWLASEGITTGWYDGWADERWFEPAAHIERQAMAAFLVRLADAGHVPEG